MTATVTDFLGDIDPVNELGGFNILGGDGGGGFGIFDLLQNPMFGIGSGAIAALIDQFRIAELNAEREAGKDAARDIIGGIPDASIPGFRLGDFTSPPIGPGIQTAPGQFGRPGGSVIDFSPAFSNVDAEQAIRDAAGLGGVGTLTEQQTGFTDFDLGVYGATPNAGRPPGVTAEDALRPSPGSALQRDTGNADLNRLLAQFSDPTFDTTRFDQFLDKTLPGRRIDADTRFEDALARNAASLESGLGGLANIRAQGVAGLETGRITDFGENIGLLDLPDPEAIFRGSLERDTSAALRAEQGAVGRAGENFANLAQAGRDPFNIASSGIAAREGALNQRLGDIQQARTSADDLRSRTLGSNSIARGDSIKRDQVVNTAIDNAITQLFDRESASGTALRETGLTQDTSLAEALGTQLGGLDTLEGQTIGAREGFVTAGQQAQTGLQGDLLSFLSNIPGVASTIEQGQLSTAAGAHAGISQQNIAAQAFNMQKALAAAGIEMSFDEIYTSLLDQVTSISGIATEDAPFATRPAPLTIGGQ